MAVSRSEATSNCDINMTPLIDVMLLLIIFIITIPVDRATSRRRRRA